MNKNKVAKILRKLKLKEFKYRFRQILTANNKCCRVRVFRSFLRKPNIRSILDKKFWTDEAWFDSDDMEWPANSQDANPCDFWLWNMKIYENIPSLIRAIRHHTKNLDKTWLKENTTDSVLVRFLKIVDEGGTRI